VSLTLVWHTPWAQVAGGLVGSTPHMMSASVLALARLLFEFGGALESTMPQLLPACLLLLRSKSRELVKSVLGLLKVAAMRLPADMLTTQVGLVPGVWAWCLLPVVHAMAGLHVAAAAGDCCSGKLLLALG
jgi:hypothetical protein